MHDVVPGRVRGPVLLALILLAGGGASAAPPAEAILRLAQECETRQGGWVGLSVVDLRSGQVLAGLRDQELFCPASNQKIVTTAFGLARLGGDFTFTTALYQLGRHLAVLGNGDPTLGDPVLARQTGASIYDELDRWAGQVRQRVGPSVGGDLILCTRRPAGNYRPGDWPDNQRRRWYQAPVAALNFNDNCLDITFDVADGQPVPIVQPQSRLIRIVNQLRLGSPPRWNALLADHDATVTLTGTVAAATTQPAYVAVDDPPLLLGRVLADRLARAGVELGGTIRVAPADELDWTGAVELAATRTPLAVALTRANKSSLNMAAESIFLYAGDGTWPGTAALVGPALSQAYGVPAEQVAAADGSGLSPTNRISPRAMTGLLAGLAARADRDVALSSLSVCGVDGTLDDRLTEAPYRGRVLGKTGYIAGVSCLSGYVLDRAGQPAVAFAVLVNRCRGSAHAKRLQDSVCRALVDWLDA